MAFSVKSARIRTAFRKVLVAGTIAFGFLSIIFSRDFDGAGRFFHNPQGGGVAHADAPAFTGAGDCSGGCAGGSCCGESGGDTGDGGGG